MLVILEEKGIRREKDRGEQCEKLKYWIVSCILAISEKLWQAKRVK